jgi:hypothetical protein
MRSEVFFFDNLLSKASKKERAEFRTLYNGVDINSVWVGIRFTGDVTECLLFIRRRRKGENGVSVHSSFVSSNSLMLLVIGPFCTCILLCFPR